MTFSKILPITLLAFLLALSACEEKSTTNNGGNNTTNSGNTGNTGNTGNNTPANDFKLEPGQSTALQFTALTMQFGPVTSGDTVKAVYPFKNMSKGSVVIKEVVTSCPCIKTEFPQGSIAPNQTGEITANFMTEGQWGTHEKILAVVLQDVPEPITLRLNGQINKKPE